LTDALNSIESTTKVMINVVEGNRYIDPGKTKTKATQQGIGWHGDTERVMVICLTIGGLGNYPLHFNWFKKNYPYGKRIDIGLNDGDLYIMSEKAVGCDWKKQTIWTLRHAAGAEKYTSLKKWAVRKKKKEAAAKAKATDATEAAEMTKTTVTNKTKITGIKRKNKNK